MAASPTTCASRLDWMDSEVFENDADAVERLAGVHGILVPGGFGERGTPGKIEAVRFARESRVPYFGICFGMQMAVIEAARNLVGMRGRQLHRIRPLRRAGGRPADRVDARQHAGAAQRRRRPRRHHAPRRLPGAAGARSRGARDLRRRGRDQRAPPPPLRGQRQLQGPAGGARACASPACRPTARCRRSWRYPDHPWFIGVQFHPELKSKPFDPHPLFRGFIGAAVHQARLV